MTSAAEALPVSPAEEAVQEEQVRVRKPRPQVKPHASRGKTFDATPRRREADAISPAAIVGFFAAIVLVFMVLYSRVQLDNINQEQATLNSRLTSLTQEYTVLSSQYEQLFDMDKISENMVAGGAMSYANSEQEVYLDLSRPDSSETYGESSSKSHFNLSSVFSRIADFFRSGSLDK